MTGPKRFEGRVAVVTGAGSGIGRATAQRFAEEGASVAILDVRAEAAVAVADALPDALALKVNVTDAAAVAEAMVSVVQRWGGVDFLINNAGGVMRRPMPFWEMSVEDLRLVTEVNYLSQWHCIRAALPSMRERPGAAIVNIASGSGVRTVNGMAAYGAAKAAVINFTHAAARELGEFGVRVNAIAPGFVRFARNPKAFSDEQVDAMEQAVMNAQALKQIGEPEDIAGAVAFLCSPDARHISGVLIEVNGGS